MIATTLLEAGLYRGSRTPSRAALREAAAPRAGSRAGFSKGLGGVGEGAWEVGVVDVDVEVDVGLGWWTPGGGVDWLAGL